MPVNISLVLMSFFNMPWGTSGRSDGDYDLWAFHWLMNKPIKSVTNGHGGISSKHALPEICIADIADSFVYPSIRQNWSPMISDCFHMLSKKTCNLLSTEIMLAMFSLHLFQVGGKGRENVHETTSHCSRLSLPKSPGAHFEIHQSVLYLYSPESAQNRSNSQHTRSFSSSQQTSVCGGCLIGGSGQCAGGVYVFSTFLC